MANTVIIWSYDNPCGCAYKEAKAKKKLSQQPPQNQLHIYNRTLELMKAKQQEIENMRNDGSKLGAIRSAEADLDAICKGIDCLEQMGIR